MAGEFEILSGMRRRGVPFVLVGGHAVNFHGFIRVTEDVDVIWQRTPESEMQLLEALTEISARYIGKEIDPATKIEATHPVTIAFIQTSHLMMLTTRLGFLDLFDYVPGIPDAQVAEVLASSVESGGWRFVSIDWLRRMKLAAGREKDRIDLENLPE